MAIQIDKSRFTNLALEERDNGVWVVTLNRPSKRNALDIDTIEELVEFFSVAPRAGVSVAVLAGAGDHFCAGLDLVEHHDADRSPADFMHVCMRWHEAFNKMEYGGVPIVAALQGAVVGGGLELASAAHVRVMDQNQHDRCDQPAPGCGNRHTGKPARPGLVRCEVEACKAHRTGQRKRATGGREHPELA